MKSVGVVREFDSAAGVGVIDSPETPGGCWVHFSRIAVDGYRVLEPGEEVEFTFGAADQDGFSYRAVVVHKAGSAKRDLPAPHRGEGSAAYRSDLKIRPIEP